METPTWCPKTRLVLKQMMMMMMNESDKDSFNAVQFLCIKVLSSSSSNTPQSVMFISPHLHPFSSLKSTRKQTAPEQAIMDFSYTEDQNGESKFLPKTQPEIMQSIL